MRKMENKEGGGLNPGKVGAPRVGARRVDCLEGGGPKRRWGAQNEKRVGLGGGGGAKPRKSCGPEGVGPYVSEFFHGGIHRSKDRGSLDFVYAETSNDLFADVRCAKCHLKGGL